MAGETLAQAEARLGEVESAIEAVLERGQSYTIGERTYTRASLKDLLQLKTHYDAQVKRLTVGGVRVRLGTPV